MMDSETIAPEATPKERVLKFLVRRRVVCATLLGLVLTSICFFPGYLNGDSQWQLQQAMDGEYSNFHPMVMAWVWHWLLFIFPGPSGIFLFHGAIFWLGLSLVCDQVVRTRLFYILVVAIGLLPVNLVLLGQIYKDIGQAGSLLLGFALLLRAYRNPTSPWQIFAALPWLWYAQALRHNSAPATLPLLIWALWIYLDHYAPQRLRNALDTPLRRIVVGTGALIVLMASVGVFVGLTNTKEEKLYAEQWIMSYDLIGISVITGEVYVPDIYPRKGNREPITIEYLRRLYKPYTSWGVLWGREPLGFLTKEEQARTLRLQWLESVYERPFAYLLHRVSVFRHQLGLAKPQTFSFSFQRNDKQEWNPSVHDTGPNRWIRQWFLEEGGSKSWSFQSWIYLVFGLFVLIAAEFWNGRSPPEARILFLSAVLYTAAYFIVGIAALVRYTWWTVLACQILPIVVATAKRRASEEAAAS